MELHLALRNIVKTDGPSIITEGRLVNILCDFQAFDAIPASKYVMRAIIDDGYSKKLLQCAKWDMNAQQLSGQFASTTGFQQDIVWIIFQSIAYGLGWTNTISSTDPIQQRPSLAPPVRQKVQLGNNPSISDVNQYFTSLIERIPETEAALGVEFTNLSFSNYSPYKGEFYVDCNVELKGKIKENSLRIKIVMYGQDSSILFVGDIHVSKNDLKGFAVYKTCIHLKGYSPIDFARILVYAE